MYCSTTLNYANGLDDIQPVRVDVSDGRARPELTWEENGFQLYEHESAVSDWSSDEEIQQKYYGEMEAFAKTLSGCDVALIGGHILRNPESAAAHIDYAPIQYVHSDFTESYGDFLRSRYERSEPGAAEALGRAGVDARVVKEASRILVLQFWRNVGPSVMDLPIAFCDAQTVPKEDVFSIHVPNYADSGEPFDTFGVTCRESSNHAWYTFPELSAREVVAFRTYDSACVDYDQPFWTPHSAFLDPNHKEAPARYSIEVRATCIYT